VVGHIPETANPGEKGSGWYFGHLESPIRGEGSVFYDLPKIPSLLRQGEKVYIIVENGEDSFLYQVTETKVVPEDQLKLYDLKEPTVILVTCVPRLIYDHRLVVTAKLVGKK
jgi:LPXTG-site transpeptidase (sortase) family protein